MENKNVKSISLASILLFFAIIAIAVMGYFLYKINTEKAEEIQKSAMLQSQVDTLTGTVNELQGKIDNVGNILSSDSTSTTNTLKPSKTISNLIKDSEEAENLIVNGTTIDQFYNKELSKNVGDAVWSGLRAEYKASSTHTEDSADYNANNLNNLYTSSCWCEGVSGTGIGESIEINAFASSEHVNNYVQLNKQKNSETIEDVEEYLLSEYKNTTITQNNISNYKNEINQIAIINGNAKTDELWNNNSRIKKLKLTIDNKVSYILELEDSKNLQLFDINYKNDSITKKINMKFEIMEVYPGNEFDDTCLTSLYLSGGTNLQWGGR